ncbi:MAG: Asd/ArgC dimerization domain-containing protein [Thermoanaerobaculia bacterium]
MSRIALVHSVSLLGKEVADRLAQRPDLCTDLRLFAVDEAVVGTLTEGIDGATFVARVEEECFDGIDLTILCGEIALDRKALALLPAGARAIVASHGGTTQDGHPAVAGVEEFSWLGQDRLLAPSPAAVGLTRLLEPMRALGLRRAVATAVLPASELGAAGIDALFEESRALLALAKPAKPEHFPAQIAFNLLPGAFPGEEIARQVDVALGLRDEPAGRIAVQTAQAGIFHAVTLSLYVEVEKAIEPAALRKLLGRSGAGTLAKRPAALGPVQAAGEEELLVGEVRAAGPGAFWIWATIDNLTVGGAGNILRLAETLLRPGTAS